MVEAQPTDVETYVRQSLQKTKTIHREAGLRMLCNDWQYHNH